MKHSALFCAVALVASSALLRAQYTDGQAESYVWGQPDFVTSTAAAPPTVSSFKTPTQVTTDASTGRFFVADSANNRVLRFSSESAFIQGAGADCVFGQPDYVTNTAGLSDSEMSAPSGVVVDASGSLWVADTANNRVLRFDAAATVDAPNGTAIAADAVLGQLDFTTGGAFTTQRNMSAPTGVAFDSAGSLYVVDGGNNRILKFTSPSSKIDGANADGLIGQTNFNAGSAATTAAGLSAPTAAAVDEDDNLWVTDTGNNRVLCFDSVSSLTSSGPSATVVIGQADFTTGTAPGAPSATVLTGPTGLSFDTLGRLAISDTGYNRILIYETPGASAAGAAADFVLGQSTFTTSGAATSQTGLSAPAGSIFAENQIFVADKANNRVVSFAIIPGTPSISVPATVNFSGTKKKVIKLHIGNSSANSDVFTAKVTIPSKVSQLATLKFIYQGQDITQTLKAGTFTTSLLASKQIIINIQVTPKSASTSGGGASFSTTLTSTTSSSATTQKTTRLKFKKTTK